MRADHRWTNKNRKHTYVQDYGQLSFVLLWRRQQLYHITKHRHSMWDVVLVAGTTKPQPDMRSSSSKATMQPKRSSIHDHAKLSRLTKSEIRSYTEIGLTLENGSIDYLSARNSITGEAISRMRKLVRRAYEASYRTIHGRHAGTIAR